MPQNDFYPQGTMSEGSTPQLERFGIKSLKGARVTATPPHLSGMGGFKVQKSPDPCKGPKGEGFFSGSSKD